MNEENFKRRLRKDLQAFHEKWMRAKACAAAGIAYEWKFPRRRRISAAERAWLLKKAMAALERIEERQQATKH
jgi:hypothetical protein